MQYNYFYDSRNLPAPKKHFTTPRTRNRRQFVISIRGTQKRDTSSEWKTIHV